MSLRGGAVPVPTTLGEVADAIYDGMYAEVEGWVLDRYGSSKSDKDIETIVQGTLGADRDEYCPIIEDNLRKIMAQPPSSPLPPKLQEFYDSYVKNYAKATNGNLVEALAAVKSSAPRTAGDADRRNPKIVTVEAAMSDA